MIDSKFHVELNGKKYTLAEDAEGAHYTRNREPLRAPTNGFVLGDTTRFNLRPDISEWSLTDWSGGEGSMVFDPENPNTYKVGYNINPFEEYGTLRLSYHCQAMTTSIGGLAGPAGLVLARDTLYLVDFLDSTDDARVYSLDSDRLNWTFVQSDTGGTTDFSGIRGGWGDATHLFFGGRLDDIVRWDGTTFAVYPTTSMTYLLGSVGGYIYGLTQVTSGANVHEVLAAGTPTVASTLIKNLAEMKFTPGRNIPTRFAAIAGSNALYLILNPNPTDTVLWKITPTTAAGAGFAEELLRIPGFRGLIPMYNFGILYVAGLENEIPVVFYYDEANGTFGVLYRNAARPTNHVDSPSVNVQELGGGIAGEFSKNHFIMIGGPSANDGTTWQLMTLDAVTGAVAGGTVFTPNGLLDTELTGAILGRHDVAVFKNTVFATISNQAEDASESYSFRKEFYTENTGIMESPVYDFGLQDDKVLLGFTLITEPLAAGTSVVVKYQIDQDGSWQTAGTLSTTGANEATYLVSTDSDTKTFNNLQVRLELSNAAAGTPKNVTPVVKAIRARATVVKGVRTWKLILNATDELGAMQNRAWDGETLISNITASADGETVIDFKDGYSRKRAGEYTAYDVVIDDYTVINDRPGEGVVHVSLREVG